MGIESRLSKLETLADSLPPSGPALLRKLQRMTPAQQDEWMKGATDEDLDAVICAEIGEPDVRTLSDEELQRLPSGESWPLKRVEIEADASG